MDTKDPVKIVLGCYDEKPHPFHYRWIDDTWTLTDIAPRFQNIMKVDARAIPYTDLEGIYASHILEHIEESMILSTLKHWKDCLKEGGQLIINVPNALWGLDAWMRMNSGEETGSEYFNNLYRIIEIFNGDGSTKADTHKSWFSLEKLENYIQQAGFTKYKIWTEFEAHDMECVIAEIKK